MGIATELLSTFDTKSRYVSLLFFRHTGCPENSNRSDSKVQNIVGPVIIKVLISLKALGITIHI